MISPGIDQVSDRSIHEILIELASDNSRLAKEAILTREKDNELLKRVFFLAYDPFTQFYQRKIPQYSRNDRPSLALQYALECLNNLSSRVVTGNAAIDYLKDMLSQLDEDDAQVLERIISKDLKCGASESTANKVWPGLIKTYPVMLCSAFDQKLVDRLHWQKGVYVQLKSDGMRCNIVVNNGSVEVFSRNGRIIETHGVFNYLAKVNRNFVIDGELLIRDKTGRFLDRKTGNGICNKALKGTGTKAQAEAFFLNAWDLIPFKDFENGLCTDDYKTRFTYLQGIIGDLKDYTYTMNIGLIESKIIHSLQEAQDIFENYLASGEEGAILKDKTTIWEDKRSKQLIKLKAELDADLLCVGILPGSGKYAGLIGSLLCETSDGLIKVNVGSGMTDEQRKTCTKYFVGKIITVTYNAKIQAKDGTWSLFLPRLVEIREDKNEANSFSDIK